MSDLYDIPGIDGPDLATLPRDDDDGCHHPDECLIEYCGNCMDEHFKQHIELKAEVERFRRWVARVEQASRFDNDAFGHTVRGLLMFKPDRAGGNNDRV